MRRRIYEVLTQPRRDDGVGRFVSLAILLLIAANVTASVLETDVEIAASAPRVFFWFEMVSLAVFSVEYVLRLWSCTTDPKFAGGIRGRLKLACSPMALIDLASIAPFYLTLLLPGSIDLRFLRVLRLLRLFRLLRAGPLAESFNTLTRVIQSKRVELGVSLAIVIAAMLLAAGAIYLAEHNQPNTPFTSIPRSMWWSIVTITTIGYGDMIPTTAMGQLIGGIVGFLGICALALPVGIISSGYIDELSDKRTRRPAIPSCPHCGRTIDVPITRTIESSDP